MTTTPERPCKACGKPLAPDEMRCAACGAHQPTTAAPLGMMDEDAVPAFDVAPTPVPAPVADEEPLEIPVEDVGADDAPESPPEPEPESEPEPQPEDQEEPAGDTVQMSLSDATKAWIEETPHGMAGASRLAKDDAPEPRSMLRALVVVVVLALAMAAIAGFLVIGR